MQQIEPVLSVRDLRTQFATQGGVVRAVDGVTFSVAAGETVGVVGESGCGKSVTALSIMRLVHPPAGRIVSGRVVFGDVDLLTLDERALRRIRGKDISLIFQDPMTSLNPLLSVGRQLSEPLRLHLGMSRSEARRRAAELLALVGISGARERLSDYPHQFSGGMRQRVMIAMALSCKPKVVLADEITTALDVTTQAQVLDVLRDLTTELGTAFVLITHDLGVVARMTQRVLVMYAGQIVESADTRELFANPKMPYTWGLLNATPRIDRERAQRLAPIGGAPPNLLSPPTGCRFAARCRYRRPICLEQNPDLVAVPEARPGHAARCWGTQDVPAGGWLRDVQAAASGDN
jgi:oligopeptide transport system ATP-binding protein